MNGLPRSTEVENLRWNLRMRIGEEENYGYNFLTPLLPAAGIVQSGIFVLIWHIYYRGKGMNSYLFKRSRNHLM